MLQLHDIRESRAYQEAREEGVKEGRKEGIEKERRRAIARMAAKNMAVAEIAAILDVDEEQVHQALNGAARG